MDQFAQARFRLQSDVQRLRCALEPLPVASITFSDDGVIESIDYPTKDRLSSSTRDSITTIAQLFDTDSIEVERAVRTRQLGFIGQLPWRDLKGNKRYVGATLAHGSRPLSFQLALNVEGHAGTKLISRYYISRTYNSSIYQSKKYASKPYQSEPYKSSRYESKPYVSEPYVSQPTCSDTEK